MTDARICIPGFTCSRRRKASKEKKGEVFQVVVGFNRGKQWGPEDLPALIEAHRLRAEQEYHRGRTKFVREARADLEQFFIAELSEAARETR
jgi:hypothetical protein